MAILLYHHVHSLSAQPELPVKMEAEAPAGCAPPTTTSELQQNCLESERTSDDYRVKGEATLKLVGGRRCKTAAGSTPPVGPTGFGSAALAAEVHAGEWRVPAPQQARPPRPQCREAPITSGCKSLWGLWPRGTEAPGVPGSCS